MASLDLLLIPFIGFEFIRFCKIGSFISDKGLTANDYKKIAILNYHPILIGHTRRTTRTNRYYTLLYVVLDCEIDGNRKRIWCFTDDMTNVFPAKRYFSYFKIIKSISKSVKGKTISGKCFTKHNVLVGRNDKMGRLIVSSWNDASR